MSGPWEKYANNTSNQKDEGPWSKYSAPQSQPDSRVGEATIEGFGRGVPVIGSYLPQLQASASMLTPSAGSETDEKLKSEGFTISQPEKTYLSERDSFIKRSDQLKQENPKAFLAGEIAGTVAGSAVPAKALGAIPKVGKLLATPAKGVIGRLAQTTGAAGAVGALENPGDVEGQYSDNFDARIENASRGMKYGVAGGVLGEGIAKSAKLVSERAGKAAEGYAFKAAGANKGDIRRALTKGKASDIAKSALNEMVDVADDATGKVVKEKLIEAGDSIEDIASKVGRLREQTGKKISGVYDEVANDFSTKSLKGLTPDQVNLVHSTNFKPADFADELRSKLGDELKGKAGGSAALSRVNSVLDDLAANGKTSGIKEMHDFRRSVDDLINYDKTLSDLPIATQKLKGIRDYISDKITSRVEAFDKVIGGTKAAELKRSNELYSKVAEMDRIAKGGLAGEQSRAFIGLLDRQSALGGAAIGLGSAAMSDDPESGLKNALIFGAGGAIASRVARRYGPAAMARVSNRAAGAFSDVPGMTKEAMYMSRRAPAVVGSTGGSIGARPPTFTSGPEINEIENNPKIISDSENKKQIKGEDRWAQNGLKKLGIRDQELTSKLLQSKEGKRLLIEASDLKPGSPALQRIMEQIQKGSQNVSKSSAGNSVQGVRRQREPARGR